MDPIIAGAGISAVGSLLGGALGMSSSNSAAKKNAAMQREFAQNGIQWKVADAKKAGIHPLYALGAQTMTPTPSYIGDNSMGNAISQATQSMGQGLTRSKMATLDSQTRSIALNLSQEQLKNAKIKNEMDTLALLSERRRLAANNNPPMPNVLPSNQQTKVVPLQRTSSPSPDKQFQEAGNIASTGFAVTPKGLTPVPSNDVKQRIEDQIIPEMIWAAQNYVQPNFNDKNKPSLKMLPKGYTDWKWDAKTFTWKPVFKAGYTPKSKKTSLWNMAKDYYQQYSDRSKLYDNSGRLKQ